MIRRRLSDLLIELLQPLLSCVVDDWGLQVEIRDEAVTIYYRGAALVRDLRLNGDHLVGSVHYKYVPLHCPDSSVYLTVGGDADGLLFESVPQPLALGKLSADVVGEYKRMMKSVSGNPEAATIHGIVSRPENRIVDQELKFQESGVPAADKIDICHFDLGLNCLSLVEVKGMHDARLRSRDGEVPEVIDQLRRYRTRIETWRDCIVEGCASSIALKRRLGFGTRLDGIPESGPLKLMRKPVLVIGGCSRDNVRAIMDGNDEWRLLRDGVKQEAAGLILCGLSGCNLKIHNGGHSHGIDTGTF